MSEARIIRKYTADAEYCRYSEGSFIRLTDGRIMFAVTRFKGARANDNAPADLVAAFSRDNGESWSDLSVIFSASDFGVANIMSISLERLNGGDIGLLFLKKLVPSWDNRIMFSRSADEGSTWSVPDDITPAQYAGKFGVNNSRLVRLSTGRLIFPLSLHGGTRKTGPRRHYGCTGVTMGSAVYSDDDGRTWNKGSGYACPPFCGTGAGIQEGCIWEISPGILKVIWRSDRMYQYQSVSVDGGENWSVPSPSCFTSPCSPMAFFRNGYTGRQYAVWNPAPYDNLRGSSQLRSPLAIAETDKSLNTFWDMRLIEDDPDRSYAYPSAIFTSEDEMLLAYSSGIARGVPRGSWSEMTISKISVGSK